MAAGRVLPRQSRLRVRVAACQLRAHQATTPSITAPISHTFWPRNSIASLGLVSKMMPRWCVEMPWP